MTKTPDCPAKKQRCGGCPLLALPYEEQLRQKQELSDRFLAPFCKPAPILGMETPFHYRNKAIATVAPGPGGKPVCGIYESRTHRVVPVRDCLLQDSRINEVVEAARAAAVRCRLSAFDEDRGTGVLRHFVVRRGVHTGEVSVTVVTPSPFFPGSRDFVRFLRAACPDVTTIVQNINPRRTSAVLGSAEKVLYGKGFIEDELCGLRFSIAARAFYQVNPLQTEKLYAAALDFAGLTGAERVIDAYCGIGTIALAAAGRAKAVLGVELNSEAVRSAQRNARRNEIKNADFLCGDAGELMTRMAEDGEKADLVFFDPPREGASRAFLEALARLAPPKAVYISCNPETQARDLEYLVHQGYAARRIHPVDMFPHTRHVETVVLLSKGEVDSKKIRVEFSLEDMDMSEFQDGATYTQIKDYVLEHSGLKVSNLYISQIKRKCGIEVGKNYNLPKSEDSRQPQCPPEKEKAIREAMKYFGMI